MDGNSHPKVFGTVWGGGGGRAVAYPENPCSPPPRDLVILCGPDTRRGEVALYLGRSLPDSGLSFLLCTVGAVN